MSTPTIANDFNAYHGDDEPVDAPSAAPPADTSSTNEEMQFDFDELPHRVLRRAPRKRRPRPRRPPPAAAVEAEALLDLEPLVADGSGSA